MTQTHVEVDGQHLVLTNLEKVLYPSTGTTKGEVLNYYAQVAPALLPQLRDRAVTRIRWPHGVADESFFEKNLPAGTPDWIRAVEVPTSGSRSGTAGTIRFPVVTGLASLMWLANLSALELHVHQWRVDETGSPTGADRIVIDLDPGPPAGLTECCQIALEIRDLLSEVGLIAFPVASGGKGLHLYAALPTPMPSKDASASAKQLAETLAARRPDQVTVRMARSERPGRVFIDWSQNAAAKTTIAPYSLRGRERPTAAAPLSWDEVESGALGGLAQLTFTQVLERLATDGDLLAALAP